MKLKVLKIELQESWSDNAGKYVSEIEYTDERGKVSMILDSKVSEALLICVGETITAFATKAAQDISTNLIASAEAAKLVINPPVET